MASGSVAGDPIKLQGRDLVPGCYHAYGGCSGAGLWSDGKLVGVVSLLSIQRIGETVLIFPDIGLFVGVESVHQLLQK